LVGFFIEREEEIHFLLLFKQPLCFYSLLRLMKPLLRIPLKLIDVARGLMI
jgi:hypothetical protein